MGLVSAAFGLSLLVSSAVGAAFHLWRGEGYGKLVQYLGAAWLGFGLGQAVGWLLGGQFAMIGRVHMVEGLLGCGIMLVLASWLKLDSWPGQPARSPRPRPPRRSTGEGS
jgi:hypothetical protein